MSWECSLACRSRGGKSPIALKVPIGPRLREPNQQKGLGSERGQLTGDYITGKKKFAALSTATIANSPSLRKGRASCGSLPVVKW